ncbi:MAG: phosphonate C-P lyase system protein PhnG [Burkholderiales bacterium]|nr:phosphonate C-P lyase system protein PhnG [Burkholderiales bacterium]
MTDTDPDPAAGARQCWLAVLAHAPRALLEQHAAALPTTGFTRLRAPEIGLTMVRARIGNQGDRFNLGDATVTRCVVRHVGADGRVAAGVGYVLGRDEARAEWVARLDALLQQPAQHDALMRGVVAPLAAEIARLRVAAAARTASSRVAFDTLASASTP